jgi:hypothetical protein
MSGSIGGGWRSQRPWRGRTCTFRGNPEGLSLSDLQTLAEPAAYLTRPPDRPADGST